MKKELRIYSPDIGMELGIEKYAMLMSIRKRHMMERIELPNQDKIRMLREKETYKYLEKLEADAIKFS